MQRAIALSAHGLATTSPNPPVGCVILDPDGQVIGEGYHERKGEAHAEVQALDAAGDRVGGATAIVTLEPCNHHGRTPPCRQALIEAGVSRVVVAVLDPTSRGDGGVERLRAAGVTVEVGIRADEARLVLGPWLDALQTGRPHVAWAYCLGPDGPSAVPGTAHPERPLRHAFDAVLGEAGQVEEGAPGAHGAGAFTIPGARLGDRVEPWLAALYRGGVRSLLIDGGPALARPFLDLGMVDRVRLYVAGGSASRRPHLGITDPMLVPPGFRLDRVEPAGGYVIVDAVKAE